MNGIVLYGTDCSHWNTEEQVRTMCKSSDFIFIKATEGRGYTDPMLERNVKIAVEEGVKFIGFYHFARPDLGNDEIDEFTHFKFTIESIMHLIPDDVNIGLALDYEVNCGDDDLYWIDNFTSALYEYFKSSILYCSESFAISNQCVQKVDREHIGLWVAKWGDAPLKADKIPWNTIAFHQYSNTPYDKSMFFGNKEQLSKYFCAKSRILKEKECGCECNCCKAGNCE